MVANCGYCTRNSFAASRFRRCFSRSMLRAPSGPTEVSFMIVGDLSTAPVAAATTTTTAGFVLRFVDLQRAAAEILAIERLHRFLRVGVRHFHEAEAARLTGVTIVD